MKHTRENQILAVIEHGSEQNTPDINYITTIHAFLNPKDDPCFAPKLVHSEENIDNLIRSALTDDLMPKEFIYQKKEGCPVKRYSVLTFQVDDPAEAARNLSKFLDGVWNSLVDANYVIALDRCSTDAVHSLAQLMKAFRHSDDTHAIPGSDAYIMARDSALTRNVENVLTKLGLMRVIRHRSSVCQCTASVTINNKSVVDFGDDLWLRRKDGTLTNGSLELADSPMYGDIIEGWGSITPDEVFRRDAIMQFPAQIEHELNDYGRNRFLELIYSTQCYSEQLADPPTPQAGEVEIGGCK